MPYPSVNLEVPPADAPKPEPSPIVAYRAHRHCYTHDPVNCLKCGATTEQFVDGEHADGSHSGWLPICEKCAPKPEPPKPEPPKPAAAEPAK